MDCCCRQECANDGNSRVVISALAVHRNRSVSLNCWFQSNRFVFDIQTRFGAIYCDDSCQPLAESAVLIENAFSLDFFSCEWRVACVQVWPNATAIVNARLRIQCNYVNLIKKSNIKIIIIVIRPNPKPMWKMNCRADSTKSFALWPCIETMRNKERRGFRYAIRQM